MRKNIFNQEMIDRSTVVMDSGCIEWVAHKPGTTGYPLVSINGFGKNPHRLVYERVHGKIPDGMCVMHKCDNRLCVNIDHLTIGTKGDNNKDRANKFRSACGEGSHLSKLTEDVVVKIHNEPGTYRGLARKYGLNKGTIKQIKTKVTWRHLWK